MLYGALTDGALAVLIDVQKAGADFDFAKDRCSAFVTTVPQAVACMRAVYAEVKRRLALNAQYGVGKTADFPDDVRPKSLVILIDEFLGLILAGKKPSTKSEDNPERERRRLERLAEWEAKKDIAYLAGRIAAEARSADVHQVLMTQKLIAAVLDDELRDLKTNLARILLGKSTAGDRMSALRDPETAPSLGEVVPPGRGIWESSATSAALGQFWFATPEQYRAALIARTPDLPEGDRIDFSAFVEEPEQFELPGVIQETPQVVDLGVIELTLDDLTETPTTPTLVAPVDEDPFAWSPSSPTTSVHGFEDDPFAPPETCEAGPDEFDPFA